MPRLLIKRRCQLTLCLMINLPIWDVDCTNWVRGGGTPVMNEFGAKIACNLLKIHIWVVVQPEPFMPWGSRLVSTASVAICRSCSWATLSMFCFNFIRVCRCGPFAQRFLFTYASSRLCARIRLSSSSTTYLGVNSTHYKINEPLPSTKF